MTPAPPALSRRIVTRALPLPPRPLRGEDILPEPVRQAVAPQLAAGHRLYAVIDGCMFPGLPELLEGWGRAYCSLLQGQAAETVGDAAPILLELGAQDPLLRWLWSAEGVPLPLWGHNAGILLLSPLDLAGVRAHLRRMVMLRDAAGDWLFFRFFAPSTLQGMAAYLRADGLAVAALFGDAILALLHEVPARDQLALLRPAPLPEGEPAPDRHPPALIASDDARRAMAQAVPRAQVVRRQRAIEARMAQTQPMLMAAYAAQPRWWRFAMAKDLWRAGIEDPEQGMVNMQRSFPATDRSGGKRYDIDNCGCTPNFVV
jgi:hypothetical protein